MSDSAAPSPDSSPSGKRKRVRTRRPKNAAAAPQSSAPKAPAAPLLVRTNPRPPPAPAGATVYFKPTPRVAPAAPIASAAPAVAPSAPRIDPEARLAALGLALPAPPAAGGNYVATVRVGNVLHCAGTICSLDGHMTHVGQVGREQTIATAYESARVCTLNTLANIKAAVGSLSLVKRIVYVGGYVNAIAGFPDSPAVINGASDFLVAVFGDAGKHARAAVAVAGLPKDSTTEIQMIVELHG